MRADRLSSPWHAELQATAPADWPAFLEERSGLPGPRANLSLAQDAAGLASEEAIEALLLAGGEYSTMCAAVAIGRRSQRAEEEVRALKLAGDARWRVREGVTIGLQLLGDRDLAALNEVVLGWAQHDDLLVQRAAVTAICEPRLLQTPAGSATALTICVETTANLVSLEALRRKQPDARSLRQALGYCWSVAIAADPDAGLPRFHALDETDPDVAWIIRENRRKKRLIALL